MRILYCNYEYPPLGGGGGVINKQIAEELAKRHTVDVLTSQGMDMPSKTVENGVTVYRVPVFFRSRQAAANLPYGGQTDFLKSDANGYVVKLNGTDEFQQACKRLLDNPTRRNEIGKYNQVAVENYYIEHCAGQYEKLYEKVIEKHKR